MLIAFHFPQNILWPFWALIPPRNFLLSLLLPGLLNLSIAFFVCCSLLPSLVGEGETDSVCLYTGQQLPPGRLLQSEPGEQNKGHSLCQSVRKSADRSKCKRTVFKEQSLCWISDTSTLYQECRLPQPALTAAAWEVESGREMSEKVTVLSYQNSSAVFFLEQGPTNCKILE